MEKFFKVQAFLDNRSSSNYVSLFFKTIWSRQNPKAFLHASYQRSWNPGFQPDSFMPVQGKSGYGVAANNRATDTRHTFTI